MWGFFLAGNKATETADLYLYLITVTGAACVRPRVRRRTESWVERSLTPPLSRDGGVARAPVERGEIGLRGTEERLRRRDPPLPVRCVRRPGRATADVGQRRARSVAPGAGVAERAPPLVGAYLVRGVGERHFRLVSLLRPAGGPHRFVDLAAGDLERFAAVEGHARAGIAQAAAREVDGSDGVVEVLRVARA